MARILFFLTSFILLLVIPVRPLQAQAITNAPLDVGVVPGTNTILIAETTNSIAIIFRTPDAFTNVLIFGLVDTNLISTNMIGTNLFNTNIVGSDFRMNFRPRAPLAGEPTNEVRYVSNLITPATSNGFLLTLRMSVRAEDLTLTNAPVVDTNQLIVSTNFALVYRVFRDPRTTCS